MELELRGVSKKVGAAIHIDQVSATFTAGSLNILLGPTLSGKTTLMRLMAGLERPTSGSIHVDGIDVTGVPVQQRNVAMVYQQFINYPNLSVFENIASPLRIARVPAAELQRRVKAIADLLQLTPLLPRLPLELSGGQQQRTALARALVKGAQLVLLDEPLANLDYKLREELREELPKIFSSTGAIFVYATTEPSEALLLGGNTATLHQGRITQFDRTLEVFHRPCDLRTAQTIADPPMNLLPASKEGDVFTAAGITLALPPCASSCADGSYTLAFHPHQLFLQPPSPTSVAIAARVIVTEITGSESFVHLAVDDRRWVALVPGIETLAIDATVTVYIEPLHLFVFAGDGHLAAPPGCR